MKYLQTILALIVLAASKRHRQRWHRTIELVDAVNNSTTASMRRIEAQENGGRPKVRVV